MKKIIILSAIFAVAVPLVGFALPLPYWGTNPPLLPCTGADYVSICQMVQLGQNVIWLGMSIVVFAIAPILIAWGGILVLTAGGAEERMKEGKKVITAALIGMALALGAFMIVNTFFVLMGITFDNQPINWADISCTQEEFIRPPVGGFPTRRVPGEPPTGARAPSGGTGWVGATPPAGTLDDATARNLLEEANVRVNKENCETEQLTDCTSLTGIPQQAVNGVIDIKNNCGSPSAPCSVVVTAGTERGHETHGMGQAILDIRPSPNLNAYIGGKIGTSNPTPYQYYPGTDGNRYYYEVDHWHVEF